MLVVLDSNVFHGDVHASQALLGSILDAVAEDGKFELFVPEVVMQELDKHYAAETKKVVREVNQAIGEHRQELRRLGIEAPPRLVRDEAEVAGYRDTLEKRLEAAGAEILPVPADLTPALPWAVNRRKPFKQTGEGFPDAAIWLAILALAVERKPAEIVFVTANSSDFAESRENPDQLAAALAEDLTSRGCAADQVRLVPGIGAFAEEIGVNFEPALARARELASGNAFEAALIDRLGFSRISQEGLGLGVWLEEDPWVESVDVGAIAIDAASELPGGRLRIEGGADLQLLLGLDVFKGDFYSLEDDVQLFVTEIDPDKYYVEADLEVNVSVEFEIVANMDATQVELELGDLSLTDQEQARRAVHGWRREKLFHAVDDDVIDAKVGAYLAKEPIESEIDEAIVLHVVDEEDARLLELVESDGTALTCHVEVDLKADVSWISNSPTPFDAEYFPGLAIDEGTGAPTLQGYDRCLLTIDLTAIWDDEDQDWRDLEIDAIHLADPELKERSARPTASETFNLDRLTSEIEDHPDEEE
jgi:predicted nucleic acid-binding protein